MYKPAAIGGNVSAPMHVLVSVHRAITPLYNIAAAIVAATGAAA